MSNCPYCKQSTLAPTTSLRPRPPNHTLMQCSNCNGYSIQHDSGRVYPLGDRTDPDDDPVTAVR